MSTMTPSVPSATSSSGGASATRSTPILIKTAQTRDPAVRAAVWRRLTEWQTTGLCFAVVEHVAFGTVKMGSTRGSFASSSSDVPYFWGKARRLDLARGVTSSAGTTSTSSASSSSSSAHRGHGSGHDRDVVFFRSPDRCADPRGLECGPARIVDTLLLPTASGTIVTAGHPLSVPEIGSILCGTWRPAPPSTTQHAKLDHWVAGAHAPIELARIVGFGTRLPRDVIEGKLRQVRLGSASASTATSAATSAATSTATSTFTVAPLSSAVRTLDSSSSSFSSGSASSGAEARLHHANDLVVLAQVVLFGDLSALVALDPVAQRTWVDFAMDRLGDTKILADLEHVLGHPVPPLPPPTPTLSLDPYSLHSGSPSSTTSHGFFGLGGGSGSGSGYGGAPRASSDPYDLSSHSSRKRDRDHFDTDASKRSRWGPRVGAETMSSSGGAMGHSFGSATAAAAHPSASASFSPYDLFDSVAAFARPSLSSSSSSSSSYASAAPRAPRTPPPPPPIATPRTADWTATIAAAVAAVTSKTPEVYSPTATYNGGYGGGHGGGGSAPPSSPTFTAASPLYMPSSPPYEPEPEPEPEPEGKD